MRSSGEIQQLDQMYNWFPVKSALLQPCGQHTRNKINTQNHGVLQNLEEDRKYWLFLNSLPKSIMVIQTIT